MEVNREIVSKSQQLLGKIQSILEKNPIKQDIELRTDVEKTKLDNIAIVQSFYGTDINRIQAATKSFQTLLQSNFIPAEWTFIEGQKSRNDVCFKWLENYGIKHIFVKTSKAQDNIFLKMPLWNIGIKMTKSEKLCFLDTDIVLDNINWLEDASKALDSNDVISLSEKAVSDDGVAAETIGKTIASKKIFEGQFGHAGMTFGCTRKFFVKNIVQFKPSLILDDIQLWAEIVGEKLSKPKDKWIQFPVKHKHGIAARASFVEGAAKHIFHGSFNSRKYKDIVSIVKGHAEDAGELFSLSKDGLPEWNDNIASQTLQTSLKQLGESSKAGDAIYFENASNAYGAVGNGHPLVVCTTCIASFEDNAQKIAEFKKMVERCIAADFTFVCFSDISQDDPILKEEGIDIVPAASEVADEDRWKQILREDVQFPKNSAVLWIDLSKTLPEKMKVLMPQKDVLYRGDGMAMMSGRRFYSVQSISKIVM